SQKGASMKGPILTRRRFMRSVLGATAALTAGLTSSARAGDLPPTESNIEGPYYRAGAPFRNQLFDDGEPGIPLLVGGQVLAPDGQPLAGALVDVWQADDNGDYDNTTPEFRGRGRQFTDKDGYYWIWTIWPGHYENPPGSGQYRPAHIHVKVSQKG